MSQPQHQSAIDSVDHNPWVVAAEGLGAALWYAMPDYVVSRRRRAAVKTAVVVGALMYGAYLGQSLEDEELEDEELEAQPPDADAVRQGLIVAAAAVVVGAGTIYFEKLIRRAADGLRDRGVSRPNTVIGIVMGALTPFAQRGIQQATDRRSQN